MRDPSRVRGVAPLALVALVAACAEQSFQRLAPESAPIVRGPPVSSNVTPLEDGLRCYHLALLEAGRPPISVGVGEIRDFTGRSSINEGAVITQGASLMAISALGKLAPAVRIHERFDPRVGELELIYTDRRQLGDGRIHLVPDPRGQRAVPWLPYMGGSILRSDWFIVGGITEVNYSIQSSGAEVGVSGVGGRARNFTMNIAGDLRIVNTRSLVVAHTVSLQKQIVGHEVGADVFRFFGSSLFDINIGTRNLEPLQLGVRMVVELGVLELVAHVAGLSHMPCLGGVVAEGAVSRAYSVPTRQPEFAQAAVPREADAVALREQEAGPGTAAERRPNGTERRAPPSRGPDLPLPRPDAIMRPPLPGFLGGPAAPEPGTPPGPASLAPSSEPTAPQLPEFMRRLATLPATPAAPAAAEPQREAPASAAPRAEERQAENRPQALGPAPTPRRVAPARGTGALHQPDRGEDHDGNLPAGRAAAQISGTAPLRQAPEPTPRAAAERWAPISPALASPAARNPDDEDGNLPPPGRPGEAGSRP